MTGKNMRGQIPEEITIIFGGQFEMETAVRIVATVWEWQEVT